MEEVGENVNRRFRGSNDFRINQVSVDTLDSSIGNAVNRKMKDSMESSFYLFKDREDTSESWKTWID